MSRIRSTVASLCLGLALLAPTSPAWAGQAELRLWIARLIETLDAGLTRADLRSLRIEIGAEVRIMRLGGPSAVYELDEMTRALVAADQAWQLLQGLPACQPASPAAAGGPAPTAPPPVSQPAACLAQLRPHLQMLGVDMGELGSAFAAGAVVQPVLVALRRQAERTLRGLR